MKPEFNKFKKGSDQTEYRHNGWTGFQNFVAQCRAHVFHPVLINFRQTVLQSGIIPTIKAVPETPFSAASRIVGMLVGSSVEVVISQLLLSMFFISGVLVLPF
jgi:hypothetical protein